MNRNSKPIRKLLVANRGEVAVRVIRTAKELGLATVAVYSETDIHTFAAELADEAYSLGGRRAQDTYLNADVLLAIAQRAQADAIHPGYGFLSEDAAFAAAVEAAGITWIGPSAASITALGDKIKARTFAIDHGVGVIPGHNEPVKSAAEVKVFAAEVGYPVLIKQADSGGGRGITRLDDDGAVERFFIERKDDPALAVSFVEKLVVGARHVETQCVRDLRGNFQVVSTRDCSVQRRNQKVVEEAPAPHLNQTVNDRLFRWSRALFDAVDYVGVGTCEFLVAGEDAYFLEVNPRLQVEHTVSEQVTGVDLVREQIRIARGEVLSELPQPRGHSIELRLTSENPADDLMPATGVIKGVTWPGGLGVRVDSFIRPGDSIGADFDSLIAKITVTAPTRAEAIRRAVRALDEFTVTGLPTCAPLLRHVLTHPDFVGSDIDEDAFAAVAASGSAQLVEGMPGAVGDEVTQPASRAGGFAVYTKWMEDREILSVVKAELESNLEDSQVTPSSITSYVIEVAGKRMELKLPTAFLAHAGATVQDAFEGAVQGAASAAHAVAELPRQRLRGRRKTVTSDVEGDASRVLSPIQGTVVRVPVEVGDRVVKGDLVVVLESMKMEKYLYAAEDATVSEIHVEAGVSVKNGDLLVSLEGTAGGQDA